MQTFQSLDISEHMKRLVGFGQNLVNAHTAAIFLPTRYPEVTAATDLDLAAVTSTAPMIHSSLTVYQEEGVIGWAAKHRQMIHISPFERDYRALMLYRSDPEVRSVLAIPFLVPSPKKSPSSLTSSREESTDSSGLVGIFYCDSRKDQAFTKHHGRILQDLTNEAKEILSLLLRRRENIGLSSWETFFQQSIHLIRTLGSNATKVLRIHLNRPDEIEQQCGTIEMVQIMDQLHQLIRQALPPPFPLFPLPSGDMLAVIDGMMSSFFEGKIEALTTQLRSNIRLHCSFSRTSLQPHLAPDHQIRNILEASIDALLLEPSLETPGPTFKEESSSLLPQKRRQGERLL